MTKKIKIISHCDFEIKLVEKLSSYNKEKIETDFDFLGAPFNGWLEMYLDGVDVMNKIKGEKNCQPFLLAYWLINNFQSFTSEEKTGNEDRDWRNRHVLYRVLGNFSPNMLFYKKGNYTFIKVPKYGLFKIPPKTLGFGIDSLGTKMIYLLKSLSGFNDKETLTNLETKIADNFEYLKNM